MKLRDTAAQKSKNLLMNRRTFCLSALASIKLAGLSGCQMTRRNPNVVLIVLDTVRAENMSCHGYQRKTTPRLDEFVKQATLYSQAQASSPYTLPTHVSMFTGQYTFEHGVDAHARLDEQGNEVIVELPVPDSLIILPQMLKGAGYATAAYSANTGYLLEYWNLHRGFDEYIVEDFLADELLDPFGGLWLSSVKSRPFFMFVNMMDPHIPYNTESVPGAFDEPVSHDRELVWKLCDAVLPGIEPAEESLVKAVTAQYDMGIANSDMGVGKILDKLKRLGVYDDSLIIITSDHGEYLGEHLLAQHSKDVHEPVLHVPLIIKYPHQREGERIATPVSLAQIYGTIHDTLGIYDLPAAPSLDRPYPLLAELNYSRQKDINHPVWGHRFMRLRTAYYEWPWKLIHSSDGKHELFNLTEDPGELKNRREDSPELFGQLMARLSDIKPLEERKIEQATEENPIPELPEDVQDALRATGYL